MFLTLPIQERKKSREGSSLAHLFRVTSEGLPVLLPYITKQILCASAVDFKCLLQYKSIKFSSFSDCEFGEKASELMPGCCVVILGKKFFSSAYLSNHNFIFFVNYSMLCGFFNKIFNFYHLLSCNERLFCM